MEIRFQTPHQYLFIHHGIKHLLVIWQKEHKKEIYIVEEEKESLLLRYPGETYREMILDELGDVFFPVLETEEGSFPTALGATFLYQNRLIGMYYRRENPEEQPFFFEIRDKQLLDLSDEEYAEVVQQFMKEFPEYIASS